MSHFIKRKFDLSVVIPTVEKKDYLFRTIESWRGTGVTIFILDGSIKKIPAAEINNLQMSIFYYHKPWSLAKRFKWFIKNVRISTKYSILQADDEYYLHSGIEKCIKTIEQKNLVACSGRCICFKHYNGKVLFQEYSPPFSDSPQFQILNRSREKRVYQHMNSYICSSVYAVMKSTAFLKCLQAATLHSESIETPEFAFEIMAAWQGKIDVLKNLFWLKSYENPSVGPRAHQNNLSLPDWLSTKRNKKAFLHHLAKIMVTRKKSQKNASKVVNQALFQLQRCREKKKENTSPILQKYNQFRYLAYKLLPKNIKSLGMKIKNEITYRFALLFPRKGPFIFSGDEHLKISPPDVKGELAGIFLDVIAFHRNMVVRGSRG